MSKYINVGCGWWRKSKSGKSYLRVKLDCALPAGQVFNIWENYAKSGEHQPDYVLKIDSERDSSDEKEYIS